MQAVSNGRRGREERVVRRKGEGSWRLERSPKSQRWDLGLLYNSAPRHVIISQKSHCPGKLEWKHSHTPVSWAPNLVLSSSLWITRNVPTGKTNISGESSPVPGKPCELQDVYMAVRVREFRKWLGLISWPGLRWNLKTTLNMTFSHIYIHAKKCFLKVIEDRVILFLFFLTRS